LPHCDWQKKIPRAQTWRNIHCQRGPTHLTAELTEAVDGLPPALHSTFPDIAVDFLFDIFKDGPHLQVPSVSTSQAKFVAQAHAARKQELEATMPAMPSEVAIAAADTFVASVQREAAALEAAAVAPPSDFAELLSLRDPQHSGGFGPLVRCLRCSSVLFEKAFERHASRCKQVPARAMQVAEVSDKEVSAMDNGREGVKSSKRRRNAALDSGPAPRKSRLSRNGRASTGGRSAGVDLNNPPLSPVLAAAAASKQERSAGSRQRRRVLSFLPGVDLDQPLMISEQQQQQQQQQQPTGMDMNPLYLACNAEPFQHSFNGQQVQQQQQQLLSITHSPAITAQQRQQFLQQWQERARMLPIRRLQQPEQQQQLQIPSSTQPLATQPYYASGSMQYGMHPAFLPALSQEVPSKLHPYVAFPNHLQEQRRLPSSAGAPVLRPLSSDNAGGSRTRAGPTLVAPAPGLSYLRPGQTFVPGLAPPWVHLPQFNVVPQQNRNG
jgi:hypothetical protein